MILGGGGFLLGLANLIWNILSSRAKRRDDRPRLRVSVVPSTWAIERSQGVIYEQFPVVEVRAEKGPVGIDRVSLRFADLVDDERFHLRSEPAGHAMTRRLLHLGLGVESPSFPGVNWDPLEMHTVLQTGEMRSWAFSVRVRDRDTGQSGRLTVPDVRLVAEVQRVNDNQVESAPFDHSLSWPGPEDDPGQLPTGAL